MKESSIPATELATFRDDVLRTPVYLDVSFVRSSYQQVAAHVFSDPFDEGVVDLVEAALKQQRPLSLVRLGDGEINILTFGDYPDTPTLNRVVAMQSVNKRAHSFRANEDELLKLAALMNLALQDADIVGVVGMWRPNEITAERFLANKKAKLRGISGQWRGIDYMLKLAQDGLFKDKVVVSAHCYFGMVTHLDRLLSTVNSVWLITNQTSAVSKIRERHQHLTCHVISLPESDRPLTATTPYFLATTRDMLPADLSGQLVLIGAGPWAEIYAMWVKERGGVGVDIGTGFDLIAGKTSRPVHRKVASMMRKD